MWHSFLFVFVNIYGVSGASKLVTFADVPDNYKQALFPEIVLNYINNLTKEEENLLKMAAKQSKGLTDLAKLIDLLRIDVNLKTKTETLKNSLDDQQGKLTKTGDFFKAVTADSFSIYENYLAGQSTNIMGAVKDARRRHCQEYHDLTVPKTDLETNFKKMNQELDTCSKNVQPVFKVTENYKVTLTDEVRTFVRSHSLTIDDLVLLADIFAREAEFDTIDEYLAAIKKESQELYDKVSKDIAFTKAIKQLTTEPREFIRKLLDNEPILLQFYVTKQVPDLDMMDSAMKPYTEEYHKFSKENKEALMEHFGIICGFFPKETTATN